MRLFEKQKKIQNGNLNKEQKFNGQEVTSHFMKLMYCKYDMVSK